MFFYKGPSVALDLLPSAETTLTKIIFYHTFQERQNTKITTQNWDWQSNVTTEISFKSEAKIFFSYRLCYSNKIFLQEWKVLQKPDHFFPLSFSIFWLMYNKHVYPIYTQKCFQISRRLMFKVTVPGC